MDGTCTASSQGVLRLGGGMEVRLDLDCGVWEEGHDVTHAMPSRKIISGGQSHGAAHHETARALVTASQAEGADHQGQIAERNLNCPSSLQDFCTEWGPW